ncbi:hypothetical protein BKM31_18040 [[Actinomadura] parvosata subsp. kistnae]|uniref:Methyltransferase type 11 domain-containing protein n=1 Tax=[Actinomadura] parvosata subsp. kistnae TaxID=1909395 RepID=A0A1U9ZYT4_9ACTN|nr:hypothetical protein [Nonomuraea sp. ATCC 55076]AQZ63112.1 hypothetical protein BKM31_18040 [Nonomuraea sp. ATCC 55076]
MARTGYAQLTCSVARTVATAERGRLASDTRVRVLRPGGLLLLADHVASSNMLVRAIQRLAEVATVPLAGEHCLRRPLRHLAAHGLSVERRDRFKLGIAERLAARKPSAQAG